MKKTTMITLLALVLALLAQLACAETSPALQGVFDALVAENSEYSKTKAMYAEYNGGMKWVEAVQGDSIVINITNSDYMDGSWTFTQDGDYLTATFNSDDFTGMYMLMSVIPAVGSHLGMDADVINGYVNGLSFLGIENDNFSMTQDEAAGTMNVRLNDVRAWDMKELDQMVLDDKLVEPLDEGYTSTAASIGKLMMVANVGDDGMTILLGEHGGLDDLAYKSIINVVNILKPAGWEDFVKNYTELADAQTEGYTVKLNAPREAVSEIIEDAKDSFSYAILSFGTDATGGEAESDAQPPEPAEAPSAEELAKNYFDTLVNLETGTAGASLKAAVAAGKVCAFAEDYSLYNPDVEPLRANMLAAFEGLSADEQAAFWSNFDVVRAMLDECLEDYDANRAAFEDAGAAEAMDEVMYDPLNRLAWENLRDYTLTLGNDMNVG